LGNAENPENTEMQIIMRPVPATIFKLQLYYTGFCTSDILTAENRP
jgi:hypothetical protein